MYKLELTEEEFVYLKVLLGKQSIKTKSDLMKSSEKILNEENISIAATFIFATTFSEEEKNIIGRFSRYFNSTDDSFFLEKSRELSGVYRKIVKLEQEKRGLF